MPARRSIFDFLRSELKQILPRATWVAAGVGKHQWEVNQWCLETGGHCAGPIWLQFMRAAHLGAPIEYSGRTLSEAHRAHPIMGGQFARRLMILKQTLEEAGVPEHVKVRMVDEVEAANVVKQLEVCRRVLQRVRE